jgi:hypothetical protein
MLPPVNERDQKEIPVAVSSLGIHGAQYRCHLWRTPQLTLIIELDEPQRVPRLCWQDRLQYLHRVLRALHV